ncbi:MAG: polyketide biosynthesis enoyl-CoA hydratase PksI [Acidobacteriota bacterium]|nr:polyketide biosynthesis enoyl-CoA hydratase PksI [Acidobacteriota bacterium]
MNEEKVVKFSKQGNIGIVALEEKEHRNTFTHRFIYGLKDTFETIGRDPEVKVVVLHGYDNYFCCGGTKEELIQLYESAGKEEGKGKVAFTDLNFHDLLLRCEVPVIAAMQGHALGAGLAFGCYADIIVMGEQCIFSAIFMKYGFTPGFGATYILPKKLGEALGIEMLMSARNYYGAELKERGTPVKIVNKQDVIKTAMEIAGELADKPLLSLKVLKKHLTRQIQADLPDIIARELEMHRLTFGQKEVLERIEKLFGN